MSVIDLKTAKKLLEAWVEAEFAVTTGQSYSIGSRTLTRANLPEIAKRITYWENKVSKLEGNGKGRRTRRFVPRDL